jgi:hypothetical protein
MVARKFRAKFGQTQPDFLYNNKEITDLPLKLVVRPVILLFPEGASLTRRDSPEARRRAISAGWTWSRGRPI